MSSLIEVWPFSPTESLLKNWIIESSSLVKLGNSVILFLSQLKVIDLNILSESLDLGGLRDDDVTSVQVPVQNDLSNWFLILSRELLNKGFLKNIQALMFFSLMRPGEGSKRCIGDNMDS